MLDRRERRSQAIEPKAVASVRHSSSSRPKNAEVRVTGVSGKSLSIRGLQDSYIGGRIKNESCTAVIPKRSTSLGSENREDPVELSKKTRTPGIGGKRVDPPLDVTCHPVDGSACFP